MGDPVPPFSSHFIASPFLPLLCLLSRLTFFHVIAKVIFGVSD